MTKEKDPYKEFLSGNPNGITPIYILYSYPLYKYGLKIVGRTEIAEDAVSEAFLCLLKKIGNFENEHQIKSFLHSTVKNICRHEIRYLGRYNSLPLESTDRVDSDVPDPHDIMYSNIISGWILQAIHDKLEQLPPRRREDFRAYFFDSKNYAQIAREHNVRPNTVEQNVKHALKKIQKHLFDKRFGKIRLFFPPPFFKVF